MSYVRGAFLTALAALTFLVVTIASVSVRAQAPSTVQDGVYSDAQATRGQALFAQRCAGCHGPKLEGAQAPPLAGSAFTFKWRREPLSALFIKIRYTMPPTVPPGVGAPQLTPEEGSALVAHVLKTNGFPAGKSDFAAVEATTSRIGWPGVPASETAPAVSARFAPTGTLNQLMRGIFFPNPTCCSRCRPGTPRHQCRRQTRRRRAPGSPYSSGVRGSTRAGR